MKIQKRKQILIITAVSLACVLTTGYILDLSSARQTKAEILTAEEQAALETDLSDPSEAETENVTEMENVAEAEDPAEADGEIPDSYTIGGDSGHCLVYDRDGGSGNDPGGGLRKPENMWTGQQMTTARS